MGVNFLLAGYLKKTIKPCTSTNEPGDPWVVECFFRGLKENLGKRLTLQKGGRPKKKNWYGVPRVTDTEDYTISSKLREPWRMR